MKRVIFLLSLIILTSAYFTHLLDQVPPVNAAEDDNAKIIRNQEAILAALEEIKKELYIVKIRASR